MAYLGNTPELQNFTAGSDRFSGNASTTTFVLARRVTNANDVIAIIESVYQDPFTAYTIAANTTSGTADIIFTSAPPTGTNNIVVNYRATQVVSYNIVTSEQLQASSVTTAKLADSSVTNDKIVAVANTKITGNIISSQITSVANTQISGNIISSQITSVANTQVTGVFTVAQGGTGAASLAAASIATLGYTTTATAAGTTTLTASNTATQFFTGSTTQTVVLPVASTMTQGQEFIIHNNSTGSLTINSSGGNLVGTLTANTTAHIICILTSGTTAASWDFDITGFTTALPVARGGTGLTTLGSANQVLAVNAGATALEFQTAGGGQLQEQLFTSPGTWTKPASATQVKVTVIGGGGGAGASGLGAGGAQGGGTSSFGPLVSATAGGGGAPGGATPGIASPGSGSVSAPATTIRSGVPIVVHPTTQMISYIGASISGLINRSPAPVPAEAYSTTGSYIAGARGGSGGNGSGGYGGLAIAIVPVSGPVTVTVGAGGGGNASSPAPGGGGGAVLVEFVG
jgi:hypothetical protein